MEGNHPRWQGGNRGVPLGVVAGGGLVIRGGTINIVVVEGKRVIGDGGSNRSWQPKVVTGEGWRQLQKVGAAGGGGKLETKKKKYSK
ncbi:hypothetical protein RHMOL_Rhmol10G0248400 [Rhododendron molle]|uniref:Uncharacterized protein n=1 Tax=Rhododendron molle TaxID=49168 RepID=A0ACC0M6D5_RHOML|nr:hypothetical protein RHMOL_Rhmol10G0248400 [Rhododendron molle]